MRPLGKEGWLDLIDGKLKEIAPALTLTESDRTRLHTECSVKALAVIENLLAGVEMTACAVGCGDCEPCSARNAAAQAEYDRKNPVIGKHVWLLPMTAESRTWCRANKAKRCKMLRRVGERFTVRAPNGRRKTFGPHDATWTVVNTSVGSAL